MRAVGKRIRSERKHQGWTQEAAAARLSVSGPFLSQVEAGARAPSWELIEAVCSWRGQAIEWLLFGEYAESSTSVPTPYRLVVSRRAAANPRSRVAWEPVEGVAVTIPGDAIAVEVVGDSMEPVALDGQVALFVAQAPSHGDLAYVELRDGRSFFKRAWIYEREWVLVSVSPRPGEEPVVVPTRQVARAFRWKGTLARD